MVEFRTIEAIYGDLFHLFNSIDLLVGFDDMI